MSRVCPIALRVDDLRRQTRFWAAALDDEPRREMSDDLVLPRLRGRVGPNLSLGMHHASLQVPTGIRLDLLWPWT
jgi:hypothetical protein